MLSEAASRAWGQHARHHIDLRVCCKDRKKAKTQERFIIILDGPPGDVLLERAPQELDLRNRCRTLKHPCEQSITFRTWLNQTLSATKSLTAVLSTSSKIFWNAILREASLLRHGICCAAPALVSSIVVGHIGTAMDRSRAL